MVTCFTRIYLTKASNVKTKNIAVKVVLKLRYLGLDWLFSLDSPFSKMYSFAYCQSFCSKNCSWLGFEYPELHLHAVKTNFCSFTLSEILKSIQFPFSRTTGQRNTIPIRDDNHIKTNHDKKNNWEFTEVIFVNTKFSPNSIN